MSVRTGNSWVVVVAECAIIVLSGFLCGCSSGDGEHDAVAHYNRGVDHLEEGRYTEAIQEFKEAVVIKPDYARAYYNMGVAYMKLKHYAEAVAACDKAIAIKPDFSEAYSNMGAAYNELGQHTEALAACKRAVSIDPDYADAYRNRAIAHYSRRDYDKAWADVKTCRKLGGDVHPEFLAELRKASGREE